MSECPSCGHKPLSIEWEKGTFDIQCTNCHEDLEPDADALINILPATAKNPKYQ